MAAAITTLLGIVVSGPLALLVVNATHPQPPWQDAALYARSYHPVQVFPYLGGLLLVDRSGLARHQRSRARRSRSLKVRHRNRADLWPPSSRRSSSSTTSSRRRICQRWRPTTTTDTPPPCRCSRCRIRLRWPGRSRCGVTRSSASPPGSSRRCSTGSRLERLTALAFVANGPVSVIGGLLTTARPGWVMTTPGLAAFTGWNLLLAAMAALALAVFRRRGSSRADSARSAGRPRRDCASRGARPRFPRLLRLV